MKREKQEYIIQFQDIRSKVLQARLGVRQEWVRSSNFNTRGIYTKTSAALRAKKEAERLDFPYRIKKVKTDKYLVQYFRDAEWNQSMNEGADGIYTKESAQQRAETQERRSVVGLKYRIKKVKA